MNTSRGPIYTPVELLARLIAFDTTSHRNNLGIVAFIEDYLLQHGVTSRRVVSADGEKASLFATIGPAVEGGVALSGHTDVVPVVGQTWTSDPFTMRAADGRLYGRGTADMKGFIAAVLAAVPDFNARNLKTPIHLAFSYDEEIGCIGVRPMLAEFSRTLPKPRMVIVGEPTSMQVVDAHKGPVRWQVDIKGRAAHSSMAPLGVNAITYAARLITELERIEAKLKRDPRDTRFDPPYATLQVTKLEGGTASNIIPINAVFGFEIRALPGLDPDVIERELRAFAENVCLPEMRATAPEADIVITRTNMVPPFGADPASDVVALALKLSGQNETYTVSYATEAGLFQDAGAPAVVCGPGDIAQAHTADEWIAESEIAKCMTFLRRLGEWAETA
ncbi:acetylornithine deacetylase [Hyphomicrobium methylovorum]|uniref:acetylornithine deacetylase n=1 Tax=Hyphomicrobium methylovorum TaxID=84 RepID=UPI0015E68B7F|nr:acetylornithine deacetylase [Hyphomicrobium methylovorum]MBA2126462.1 acetylornithine deacetylase [Hyphomicrobium methylovorum]